MAFLTQEETKEAFGLLTASFVRLLAHLFPRRLSGEISFGMEDPCDTGLVLAGLGMTLPFHQNRIEIHPDLQAQKTYVRGRVFAAGHFMVGFLLFIVLRFFLSKAVRETRVRLKKLLEFPLQP